MLVVGAARLDMTMTIKRKVATTETLARGRATRTAGTDLIIPEGAIACLRVTQRRNQDMPPVLVGPDWARGS